MEKEFIPYEQALALKELGFDEPCFGYYRNYGTNKFYNGIVHNMPRRFRCTTAPLYQQAFRWFREKYNCHKYIEPIHRDGKVQYEYCVVDSSNDAKEFNEDDIISTYEEAELECLKKLIEIIKTP